VKVKLSALTRVEGEGALELLLEEGRLKALKLEIYEPPRFIEALLKGKSYEYIPDITARICGICPVAYQFSSLQAIERAFDAFVPEEVERARRLMYYGEWIQSHALHIFFLHLPDFYRLPSIVELSRVHKELVLAGLDIKRAGSLILQKLGGRSSHPVSPVPGGFSYLPEDLSDLKSPLELALEKSLWVAEKLRELSFPNLELEGFVFVSLVEEDYPILKGDIYFEGRSIKPEEFKEYFVEEEVEYSTAKHARMKDGRPYLVGALSRLNNNFEKLSELAVKTALSLNLEPPLKNPYKSILVRLVEVVHALERAIELVDSYIKPPVSRVEIKPKRSEGVGISEAPRGILWHRYTFDEEGKVLSADIVPPTSQNQKAMELSLFKLLQGFEDFSEKLLRDVAEPMVRNFDPCISCATHFLRIRLKHV
jgi:coenzyme F420-reducing hydrogenase alpha subunit